MVRELLDTGRFRLRALVEVVSSRRVAAEALRMVDPHLRTLWNLNTPDDYRKALDEAGFPPEQSGDVTMA